MGCLGKTNDNENENPYIPSQVLSGPGLES